MSTSQNIVMELLGIFADEAEDHIRAINRGLLALEEAGSAPSDEVLQELFRAAHSLKGAARAVNLPQVESLAHELEDLFADLQRPNAVPEPNVIQEAYGKVDALENQVRAATALGATGQGADGGGDGSSGGSAAPAPSPASPPSPAPSAPEETVRVATGKLDALIAQVGELVISRLGTEQRLTEVRELETSLVQWEAAWRKVVGRRATRGDEDALDRDFTRLKETRRSLARLRGALDADARRLAQVTIDLEADVRRTRLLPLTKIFDTFPRIVRDLAKDRGKDVVLVVRGGDTELDRSLLEQVKDPLVHLIRNCVEHGIEPPAERSASGKPSTGTISISAHRRGESLVVDVADDGTGIDAALVRRRAVERGLLSAESAAELPEQEMVALIFRPGLSTAETVTELSGRGVGLDAVRDAVERLQGSVSVETRRGEGTVFSLTLPLAVSTMHSVLLEARGQTFALPVAFVERILSLSHKDVVPGQGRQAVLVDGKPVVLVPLADLLGIPAAADEERSKRPAVVVASHDQRVALLADRVTRTGEVVTKKLPEPLFRVRHVAGATILGSGEVALILSPPDLLSSLERHEGGRALQIESGDGDRATVLIAEDSITTRTLEKNILEAAGYSVVVARDGLEAWTVLEAGGCNLIVADVEMPKMDGFALTARVRSDRRFRELPVVLVTSRSSREDRERGVQAGADAYIVKGAFDQERLLDTIGKLL